MKWIRHLSAEPDEPAEELGGKAHGLVLLHRLGCRVPAGFVITAAACRAFLRDGRAPDGLRDELVRAAGELERGTGRVLGGPEAPLAVSVRSGAGVSMPGMMNTVLNLGLTTAATEGLAAETGDRGFAEDSRLRFLTSFAGAVTDADVAGVTAGHQSDAGAAARAVQDLVLDRCGRPVPDDAVGQLEWAVESVFASWNTPRARTYRSLNGIPEDLGTAVVVQRMVFGNRDGRSGTGVAFSRDPNTGGSTPYGEVLFGRQGEDVVSGSTTTRPLGDLAEREPQVWSELLGALRRIEAHYRDACYVEFTFEAGELWLLQVRPGRFVGGAAVRLATELADERMIDHGEALLRVAPGHLRHARTPRVAPSPETEVLARGVGACPGVAVGRVATTAEGAVRMARGAPVILVRPETSPNDMHGLAAAAGIVTARGGPASHAAVVARSMGRPAVVGVVGLRVDSGSGSMTVGGRTVTDGTLVTIDGTGGEVVLGAPRIVENPAGGSLSRLLTWADEISGRIAHAASDHSPCDEISGRIAHAASDHSPCDEISRLEAAHAVLRAR
ncbi:Pyruvate, phosphate dikinase [Streptomyces sp. YIM 130001]|uniref:pyruvate, phosphate dikinase n=1 Tax=Streptomyces sp. YIM 130001 TaxID=2259644 RepID=UPI000E659D1A|nr:pyruvate, phosphate dikinase [Streptomyces sp. YIM 130001]RII20371.1 Pyruvate, phosphate dikinase [Streptomyces sp. YIM 130001]